MTALKRIPKAFWMRAGILLYLFTAFAYASSGVYAFLGNEFLLKGNADKALAFYRKADRWLSRQSAVYEGAALSARTLASKDKAFHSQTLFYMTQWAAAAPASGKARIFLAETLAKLYLDKELQAQGSWKEIKVLLKEASALEPGNAWIAYKSGSLALAFKDQWAEGDEETVLRRLAKASRIRYQNAEWRYIENASPFLEPVLTLLLRHGFSYEVMKAQIPPDYLSQRVWMDFLEKNRLWKFRQLSYENYQKTAEAYYDQQCGRGEQFFRRGDYLRAYYAFRKAFWSRDWAHIRAKAGILASEYKLGKPLNGKHELMKEEINVLLKQITEEKDFPAEEEMLEALRGMTVLLNGEVLEKNPSPSEAVQKGYDSSLWWGNAVQRLVKGAQMNYPLPLEKGLNLGTVELRLNPAQEGAFAVLTARVNQREVGEFLVDNEGNKAYAFKYPSAGGKRWLQLEVKDFHPADAKLEFGTVEIKTEGPQ